MQGVKREGWVGREASQTLKCLAGLAGGLGMRRIALCSHEKICQTVQVLPFHISYVSFTPKKILENRLAVFRSQCTIEVI